MRLTRILPVVGFCALAGSLVAQPGGGKKCDPYLGGGPVDPTPLFNSLDLNHDGKVTHDEWEKTEAPTSSWGAFGKKALVQKHGYITLFDFLTDDAPGTIDTSCDGAVSLDEFLATKKMAAPGGGAPGGAAGGAPSGAAPQGGAPGGAAGGPGGAPSGAGGPGGAPGGGTTVKLHPDPTAPREALAEGSYSKTSPGKYPPYADGGAADPAPFFNSMDANHDGMVTNEEWQKAGAPEALWQAFAAKPRVKAHGYATLYDLVMNPKEMQIKGVDTNEDGYISLDEVIASSKWTMGGGPGGPGGAPPQGAPGPGGAPGGGGQSGGVYLKSDKMIAELDVNHDGCVSKQEWTDGGLPEAIFGTLEGQAEKRDCVTNKEMTKGAAPAGIDTDGDGYLTVAEMKAYISSHGTEPK